MTSLAPLTVKPVSANARVPISSKAIIALETSAIIAMCLIYRFVTALNLAKIFGRTGRKLITRFVLLPFYGRLAVNAIVIV